LTPPDAPATPCDGSVAQATYRAAGAVRRSVHPDSTRRETTSGTAHIGTGVGRNMQVWQ